MRVKFNRFKAVKPNEEALQKYLVFYSGLKLYTTPETLPECSSQVLFGNDHPLVLDLGCGQGEFVIGMAKENPDKNFVGIDRHWKSLYVAINSASASNLPNVKFVRQDLRQGFKKIPDSSVGDIYILFPPPPTKVGLVKTEFFNDKLVGEIERILNQHGKLVFASDKDLYFQDKSSLLIDHGFMEINDTQTDSVSTRFNNIWVNWGIAPKLKFFRKDR